jgi:hypothetical protein
LLYQLSYGISIFMLCLSVKASAKLSFFYFASK